MNKTAILVLAMMVMTVGSVMAAPSTGFHLDNDVLVTGDWLYDGGWTLPVDQPVTAQFEMAIDSSLATKAQFMEKATFGTPWHLDYSSVGLVDAPVKFENKLVALTVNSPLTTPGVAWTKVKYTQMSFSDFSGSSLSVSGFGEIVVSSKITMDAAGQQSIGLNIN